MSYNRILDFWFGELESGLAGAAHRKRWYKSTKALDAEIGERFGALLESAAERRLGDWFELPLGRLAFIVLCDQFPRNAFRGTAEAFAFDALALHAAKEGIHLGEDRSLEFDHRNFFYMPIEHSENLLDQHACVGLFSQHRDEAPADLKDKVPLGYAHQHRDIIIRFGRFPHRNDALGRASTPEEQTYLADGHTFGQR